MLSEPFPISLINRADTDIKAWGRGGEREEQTIEEKEEGYMATPGKFMSSITYLSPFSLAFCNTFSISIACL